MSTRKRAAEELIADNFADLDVERQGTLLLVLSSIHRQSTRAMRRQATQKPAAPAASAGELFRKGQELMQQPAAPPAGQSDTELQQAVQDAARRLGREASQLTWQNEMLSDVWHYCRSDGTADESLGEVQPSQDAPGAWEGRYRGELVVGAAPTRMLAMTAVSDFHANMEASSHE